MFNGSLVNVTDALPKPSIPSISLPNARSGLIRLPSTYTRKRTFTHPKKIEYAKDLGDILLGGTQGTLQLQNTLDKHDAIFQNVPILNRLEGLGYMTYDRFLEPLFRGDITTAFINSLETMGGSLDILSNPVKSLLPWAGGGNEGDFLRSMGWMEGEYRKTYQWNTGNFVIDIIGETISDPVNWVTWGSKAMVSAGVKAPQTSNTVMSILQSTSVYKPETNQVLKLSDVLMQQDPNVREQILRMLGESLVGGTREDVLKKLEQIFMDQVVDIGVDKGKLVLNNTAKRLYIDTVAYKQLQKKIVEASESGLFDAYKTASRTLLRAKKFDETLARVAADLTPFGWGKEFVKYGLKPGFDYIHNSAMRAAKKYQLDNPTASDAEVFEYVKREVLTRGRALSTYESTGMADVLRANGIEYSDAGNMFMDVVASSQSKVGVPRDTLTLRDLYQNYILSRMDGVYIARANDPIYRELAKQNTDVFSKHVQQIKVPLMDSKYKNVKVIIPQSVFNQFFKEIQDDYRVMIKLQDDLVKQHLDLFYKDMKKIFSKEGKKELPFDRPSLKFYEAKLDKSLSDKEKKKFILQFNNTVITQVTHINRDIRELKNLATTILAPKSGWLGSYTDLTQFWKQLRDKDPAVTYTVLGELLNHGLSDKASNEVVDAYTKYINTYKNLTMYIQNMDKNIYMKFDLLNTHDIQNNQQVLKTLYGIFNDIKKVDYTQYYPIRDVIGYLNGGFLNVKGAKFTLGELDAFFKALEEAKVPYQQREHFQVILNYYGINKSNGRMIQELWNKRDPLSMAKLEAIIGQGKTGHRMYNAGLDKFKNIDMRFKDIGKIKADVGLDVQEGIKKINEVLQPDKTFEEMVDKANENLKSMGEYFKNLTFTDIPAKDMAFFEALVDGTGLPLYDFTQLWQDVLATDITNLTREQYVELANRANAVIQMISNIYGVAGDKRLPKAVDTFLSELLDTMQHYVVNTESALIEQLDLSEKIYMALLSRENMTHVLFDTEFNQLDTQYGLFLNELKNPTSKAREFTLGLAAQMEEAGATETGELIRNMVLNVDNHVAYNRLMQMKVDPLFVKFDDNTSNYINSLIYNRIASDKYRNWAPMQLINQLEDFVNNATNDAERYIRNHADELVQAKLDELTDVKKFIKSHAEMHGIPVSLDTNKMIRKNKELAKHYEDAFGFTDGKTIHIAVDKIKVDKVLHSYNIYEGHSFQINPNEAARLIKDTDDAILAVYLHEASHFINKDFMKHDIEPAYSAFGYIASETTARAEQIRSLQNLVDKEALIKAEVEHIRAVYYEEAALYLDLLNDNNLQLGLDSGKVYNVLDGTMLETVRQMGNQYEYLKEVFENNPDGVGIMSDYDFLTATLYGKTKITEKNHALFGLRVYDKDIVENLNDSFTNQSFLDATYEAFRYIGEQNKMLAGTTGSTKELGELHNLLTESQVTQLINNAGSNANLYEWSVANKTLAFKTVYDPAKALELNIDVNNLAFRSQEEYLEFYNKYLTHYERARNVYEHFNNTMLLQIRDSLIDTYKHAGTKIAPKDAMTYFLSLDLTNELDRLKLMAWDGLTQDLQFSTKTAREYSDMLRKTIYNTDYISKFDAEQAGKLVSHFNYDKMEYFRNPWRWYQAVDTAEQQLRANNIEPLLDIIKAEPPRYILDDLYARFDYNISSLYKSKDKLLHDSRFYAKYINDDLGVRRVFTDTMRDTMDVLDDYYVNVDKMDDVTRKFFRDAGVRPTTKMTERPVQTALKEYIQTEEAMSIADSTAQELRRHVDMRGGFIVYVGEPDRVNDVYPFKVTPEEMRSAGLEILPLGSRYTEQGEMLQNDYIYIIRRTDKNSTNIPVRWKKFEELNEPGIKKMLEMKDKLYKGVDAYIDREGIEDIPTYYLTGDTMDNEMWDAIRNMPAWRSFFGDIEQQKTYLDLTESGAGTFYKNAYSRPQVTIVGRDAYNRFIDFMRDDAYSTVEWSYKAKALDTSLQTGMIDFITRHNNKTKLLSICFNDEFDIANEFFQEIFKDADDKYLQEFFQKGKYTAAIVLEDKNGNPIVEKYIIRNKKTLQEAIEMHAHVVPEAVFRNMMFTINKHEATSKLMMLYRRTVVGLFKSIWLTSPGFLMRNFVDSDIYKNMNETGGLVNIVEMLQYEYQATKLLDFANQVQAEVFARTNNQTFNRAVLTEVLMELTPEERQWYYLTDTFINSGASGSLTEAMEDFLLQFNKNGAERGEYAWERALNHAVFEGKYSPTRMIMDVNGTIEQSARFGLFLALIDKGGISVDDALARVIRTHFDYTVKNAREDVLEQLFWFATFPMNNILYFVNEGLERNPQMLKLFMDMNELSWNNGEYTYDQVKEKSYLAYHAMAGNIRWRIGHKDYILKLGPSLFDFFNFMVNPLGEMLNRLNPIISVPLGLDEPAQLNPINAQIARAKTILTGGPILPSIYSTMEKKPGKKYPKVYNTYYESSWNPRPRKGRHTPVTRPYYVPGYSRTMYMNKFQGHWRRNRTSTSWFSVIGNKPYYQPKPGQFVSLSKREYMQIKKLPIIPPEYRPMVQSKYTPNKKQS